MLTTLLYGISIAIVVLYCLQVGVTSVFGKSANLISRALGKGSMSHYVFHIVVAVAAIGVALAHIPIFGQKKVYIVDGFEVQEKCMNGDKPCTKGEPGCVCVSTGCTKKVTDGSGNETTADCKYPEDKSIESCKPCSTDGFAGQITDNVVDVQEQAVIEPSPIDSSSLEGAPWSA